MTKLFIVEALRFGNRENHSYVVGVFDSFDKANLAALTEECWRGGKYVCEINEQPLNFLPEYKAKNLADFFTPEEIKNVLKDQEENYLTRIEAENHND